MEHSSLTRPWLDWAVELQSIAQCGLTYARDVYDVERYRRLRDISAEMLSYQGDMPLEKVKSLFCNETGYQTPKLDSRAAVFNGAGQILLVHERGGGWSLPGGWVDVNQSIASNTVKEVREEAGLDVRAERIIAVQDRNRHNPPPYPYGICKVFVLCALLGGAFQENSETTESGYFPRDGLPPLALEKCTPEQVGLCFDARDDPRWVAPFD